MSALDLSPPRTASWPAPRLIGAGLVLLVAGFALIGPLVIPGDPFRQSLLQALSVRPCLLKNSDQYANSGIKGRDFCMK